MRSLPVKKKKSQTKAVSVQLRSGTNLRDTVQGGTNFLGGLAKIKATDGKVVTHDTECILQF